MTGSTNRPTLSLILCTRNDAYMGNSRWRLETTLNYVGAQVAALGCEDALEVIVADWGSNVPLSDVVVLDPAAARIVSFLTVPPAVARERQKDSQFPEVVALNAAARRARGTYIGRIDQDTLVGARFLRQFLRWVESGAPGGVPLDTALWFANRRDIPYRFAVRCPSFPVVAWFVRWFGGRCRVDTAKVFYRSSVGVWLLHRDLWEGSGGYDERMIYMNDMEIDMAARLMTRYPMVDLGRLVDYDFYHLEHFHPGVKRASSVYRKVNSEIPREPRGFNPNGAGWGLAAEVLGVTAARAHDGRVAAAWRRLADVTRLATLVVGTGAWMGVDRLRYGLYPVWRHRATVAWQAVRRQPVGRWPQIISDLRARRGTARDVSP